MKTESQSEARAWGEGEKEVRDRVNSGMRREKKQLGNKRVVGHESRREKRRKWGKEMMSQEHPKPMR